MLRAIAARDPMLDSAPCPTRSTIPPSGASLDAAARKGVTLEVTVFDESTHTAAEAAAAVGAELGQIVKSLVFVTDGDDGPEPILALVSGPNRVDLARLAAVIGASDDPAGDRPRGQRADRLRPSAASRRSATPGRPG